MTTKKRAEKLETKLFGPVIGNNLITLMAPITDEKLVILRELVREKIDQHLTDNNISPESVNYNVTVAKKNNDGDEVVEIGVSLLSQTSKSTLNTFSTWNEKIEKC